MCYYVSAWNKLSKVANICTASWEFTCMAGPSSPTHVDFKKVPIRGGFLCGVKAHSQRTGKALNILCKIWVWSSCQNWFSLNHASELCHFIIHCFTIVFKNDFPRLSHSGQSECHLVLSIMQSFLLFWDFCLCSSGWILALCYQKVQVMKVDALRKFNAKMYKFKNFLLLHGHLGGRLFSGHQRF